MLKPVRGIAFFLVFCLFNTLCPLSVLAADVSEIINQLTPQQKEQLKNLSPEDKAKAESLVKGSSPSGQPTAGQQETSGSNKEISNASTDLSVDSSAKQTSSIVLSKIEKGFNNKIEDKTQPLIQQFGYAVFGQTVGTQFSLLPSIPIGPDYRINPGDKLLITIWGNVNDTFSLTVDERGAVTLPKVGVVTVAGLTLTETKDILYERLSKIFIADFNLDLTIKEIGSIKGYMLGEFVKPGAYTLLANTSLYDSIFIGGGPTKDGSLRKIELVRRGQKIRTIDLYNFVLNGSKRDDTLLQSGDVIRIPTIGKVAAISGNVKRPAIYELLGKTELSAFINLAGGITPTSYLQRIQITHQSANTKQVAIDVNYADYLKIKNIKPVYVDNQDFVSVFSMEPTLRDVVYLSGNVIRAGQYELKPGMRLMDLIQKAEGLAPGTYMERAQIYRLEPPDMHPSVIAINLAAMKKGSGVDNPVLREFDRVQIFAQADLQGIPKVYVSGELNNTDQFFTLTNNMRISDLVFQAGGVKDSAYLEKAELARTQGAQVVFYEVNLRKILLEKDTKDDLLLQNNDYLLVRKITDYGVNKTVTISGNVQYPGKYVIYPGEKLSSLISRVGGYTQDAFLDGAVFIRQSLKVEQQQMREKLTRELQVKRDYEMIKIPVGLPTAEAQLRMAQVNAAYQFADSKLSMDIPGRLIINLDDLRPGNSEDFSLQEGDTLNIPGQVNGVTVMGEVYYPGTILHEDNKSIDYYINYCGGATEYADKDKILILRASGIVERKEWNTTIKAGDTILVSAKPVMLTKYQEPFDWNKFWGTSMQATTAVTQALVSLATIYLLIQQASK